MCSKNTFGWCERLLSNLLSQWLRSLSSLWHLRDLAVQAVAAVRAPLHRAVGRERVERVEVELQRREEWTL